MARIKMVTRTIKVTNFTVLTINLVTRETAEKEVSIPSAEDLKEKELKRELAECLEENEIVATILSSEVEEQVWGMPEKDFLMSAAPMVR